MNDVIRVVTILSALVVIAVAGYSTYLLSPVLVPFLVAATLAYILTPLVNSLTLGKKFKMPKTLAVTLVFVVFILFLFMIVLIIIPIFQKQISELIKQIPTFIAWTQDYLMPRLSNLFNLDATTLNVDNLKNLAIKNLDKTSNFVIWFWGSILHSSMDLIKWLINVGLIFVVTFYLLRDWNQCTTAITNLLPTKHKDHIIHLAKKCDETLGLFFRGQLLVIFALIVVYSLGLMLAGIKYSLLIGMTAGLLSIIPYLGGIIGLLLAALAAIFQTQEITSLIKVAIVFGVGNIMEGMVLTPLLIGDKLGLHPVVVIFALLAGGQLFGFVGILLALPITAVLVTLLREKYSKATLMQHKPAGT